MKSKKIKMMLVIFTAFILGCTGVIFNIPNTAVVAEAATEGTYQNFKYTVNGNEACITGYSGSDSSIQVPGYLNVGVYSYKVTSINEEAFENCDTLKNVTLPDTVETIGRDAFRHCVNLENVILPDTIKTIENSAFGDCNNLKKINIPSSVTKIKCYTFSSCFSLESIDIPENVTTIQGSAFENCKSLKTVNLSKNVSSLNSCAFMDCSSLSEINVDDENSRYTSINGVVYSKDKKTLISCPAGKEGEYTVSDGTAAIGDHGFYTCRKITKINVPDSVTSVAGQAFCNCTNLSNIVLPDNINSIGEYAFSYCSKLESIIVPKKITSLSRSIFDNCTSLKKVNLPEALQSIGEYAFENCKSLKVIEIPSSVTSIAKYTFEGCDSLENIIYPYRNKDTNSYVDPGFWTLYSVNYLTGSGYEEIQLVALGKKFNTERDNFILNLNVDNKYTLDVTPPNGENSYNIDRKTVSKDDYIISKDEGWAGCYSNVSIKPKEEGAEISFDNVNYSSKIDLTKEDTGKKTVYIKYANGEIAKGIVDLSDIKIDNTYQQLRRMEI